MARLTAPQRRGQTHGSLSDLIQLLAAEGCSMPEIVAATGRRPKTIRNYVDRSVVPVMRPGPRRRTA